MMIIMIIINPSGNSFQTGRNILKLSSVTDGFSFGEIQGKCAHHYLVVEK